MYQTDKSITLLFFSTSSGSYTFASFPFKGEGFNLYYLDHKKASLFNEKALICIVLTTKKPVEFQVEKSSFFKSKGSR